MSALRELLAEDQAMVRGALVALLELDPDVRVVAQVARGDEVLAAARMHRPDVALLDIEMPGLDGLAATAALTAALPDCRVVVLTTFGRSGYLRRAMENGAAGFLLKDAPSSELVGALRRVVAGERVVDPGLAAQALSDGDNPLTARERDVLRTAGDGAPVDDVARRLFLSPGTVRNHLSAAIRKTGTRTRIEAVLAAERRGWL